MLKLKAGAYDISFVIFGFFYMKLMEEILLSNIVPRLDLNQLTRFEFFE